jgi:hypothetical protein
VALGQEEVWVAWVSQHLYLQVQPALGEHWVVWANRCNGEMREEPEGTPKALLSLSACLHCVSEVQSGFEETLPTTGAEGSGNPNVAVWCGLRKSLVGVEGTRPRYQKPSLLFSKQWVRW